MKFPFALKVPNKNKKMPEMRMFHRENRKKKLSQNGRCTSKLAWTIAKTIIQHWMEWVSQVLNNFVQTGIKSSVPPNKNKVRNIVWFLKIYTCPKPLSKSTIIISYYIPFSGKICLSHMYSYVTFSMAKKNHCHQFAGYLQ